MDLRLALFPRLHKVSELSFLPMFAPGIQRVYARACMPLDQWLSARLTSVTFAHSQERQVSPDE
jgi:hypothetical protein